MELKLVSKTSRTLVFELTDSGKYYSEKQYEIYIDGEIFIKTNKVITSLYNLKPNTEYNIEAVYDNKKISSLAVKTDWEYVTLNVKDFGAYGDGEHDDTNAIQAAIMSCPKDSRIFVPDGVFKISSIFLKSDITIELSKNAVLSAFTKRDKFPILPGMIENYDENDEYNIGSSGGNPLDVFSSIVTGINVKNVVITGSGTIDGCASVKNWWKNPKVRDIAWRPKLLFLNHCENIIIQGITVKNSPSWTLHPYFSKHLKFIDVKIINPADSPNTDGLNPESCDDVLVIGVYISVGDDCIAIKSGKIYMGRKYKVPTSNMIVRQCCMRDGHGAVTVGSENAAGIKDVHIRDCIFINTDRGLRIKTRRGRGKLSVIDNISFENIDMDNVMTPIVVNCFYFCDPDGRTEYVASKEAFPIDDRTPYVKRLLFKNINAQNCHVAGVYMYGLPESKIGEVTLDSVNFSYAENAKSGMAAMMIGCEEASGKGIIVNNINKLILKNVKADGCVGEAIIAESVDEIVRD